MQDYVCSSCHTYFCGIVSNCPQCGSQLSYEGDTKNVIDHLPYNCLIYRYDGSDMLEPAVILKSCKTNVKVATRLKEYANPVTVPKSKVYLFDQKIFSAIQALRNERTAVMHRFDEQIQNHWQQLKQYSDDYLSS